MNPWGHTHGWADTQRINRRRTDGQTYMYRRADGQFSLVGHNWKHNTRFCFFLFLEKFKHCSFLLCTMVCEKAQTSRVWLIYGLMRQWYSSLSDSSHWLACWKQFFLVAAAFHSSSVSGQLSTGCTVSLDTGHDELLISIIYKELGLYINIWVFFHERTKGP